MRSYRPGTIAGDPRAFQDSVRREFDSIRAAANRPEPYVDYQVLHAEPATLVGGRVAYADGSDWNPGSGEGLYRRNAANSAWVFIG